MSTTENLITVNDLHFSRGERVIYEGIDMAIPKGKVIAVMGPSGCGKTTLLRLIGAKLRPQSGSIIVDNQNVFKLSRRELYKARRKMGLLFQSGALFTSLSAYENVAFPLREHTNLPETLIRRIVLMKLQAVGLRGASELMPSELSGGMARRVALARAIAMDPQLVMYDEPFTGLDPIAMGVIVQLIRKLNDALGLTSIVVTHDVPEVMSIADYVYVLANGKVIGEGTPEEVRQDSSPLLKQFIQGLPDGVVPYHYPAKDYAEDLLEC